MKRIVLTVVVATLIFASCNIYKQKNRENVLLQDFNTPYGIPKFDKIKPSDFIEAYKIAIEQHKKELSSIVNCTDAPNFKNTILALDNSGKSLDKIESLFELYVENLFTPELDSIGEIVYSMNNEHRNSIYSDSLVKRIEKVYMQYKNSQLSEIEMRILEKYYNQLHSEGVFLTDSLHEKYLNIKKKIADLGNEFSRNLMLETNTNKLITVTDSSILTGVPNNLVVEAKERALLNNITNGYLFTVNKVTCISILENASNRDLRKQVFHAFYNQGNNNDSLNNKNKVKNIANLRHQLATIFGFKNYFEYVLPDRMENKSEEVKKTIETVWGHSVKQANIDLHEMEKLLYSDIGEANFKPWDWWYYANKLKEQKFNFSADEIKPYFSLNNCMLGVTTLINKLYKVSLNQRNDLPLYNEDVYSYELLDDAGKVISIIYFDPYYRETKEDRSFCTFIRNGNGETPKDIPLIIVSFNYSKPRENDPCLLSSSQVKVLFHEFGHALNLSFDKCKYSALKLNSPMDCIELPSSIMEYWAFEKDLLKLYAKHYKTGKTLDMRLIDKIIEQSNHNRGFANVEYLGAAFLDLAFHSIEDTIKIDIDSFENKLCKEIGLPQQIYPRYKSTNFRHAFGANGIFASGYYTYLYSDILAAQAFDIFKRSGNVFNQDIAAKFKQYCLSEFGQNESMVQYVKFSNEKPKAEYLLKYYGFK